MASETDLASLREFLVQYNNLSESCFVDCVRDFTSRVVSTKEQSCVTHCMDKYLKMTQRMSLRFQEHQLIQQEAMGPTPK